VNLLNAAVNAGVQTFVFTSSIAVYGSSPELPMTEETPPHPKDSYGIAKQAIELEQRACRDLFDLDFMIFRPHNVYGPHQNIADRYRSVIGIFMNQISPSSLHCCGIYQRDTYARERLRTWLSHPAHPPVIAMPCDPLVRLKSL
jgi:nucleoside-diphosphate-sugar epimerase